MGICRFCQNFPVKCPCSETFELCEIKQQQKTKTKNKKQNQKKKKKLEFHVKFLTLLNFLKIEFQNRDVLLDSFKIRVFCYIF